MAHEAGRPTEMVLLQLRFESDDKRLHRVQKNDNAYGQSHEWHDFEIQQRLETDRMVIIFSLGRYSLINDIMLEFGCRQTALELDDWLHGQEIEDVEFTRAEVRRQDDALGINREDMVYDINNLLAQYRELCSNDDRLTLPD